MCFVLQLALRCSVDAISFSAHADFPQTSDFLDIVNPPHVVLVHGEAGEMMRLKKALEQRAKATDVTRNLYTPKVTQPVHIRHQPRHVAKVRHFQSAVHCLTAVTDDADVDNK